jgi:hypothetical protein
MEIVIALIIGFASGIWRSRVDFPPASPSGKGATPPKLKF